MHELVRVIGRDKVLAMFFGTPPAPRGACDLPPEACLRYLVAHPGRLVTKAELRQHVWAGTHVTEPCCVCVRDIRAALGYADQAQQIGHTPSLVYAEVYAACYNDNGTCITLER